MSVNDASHRFSLICFFVACFSLPARAESTAPSIPQIEVQAIDMQVPAALLTQLEQAREKNLAEKKQQNLKPAPPKNGGNLIVASTFVRPIQPNTMEEKMADNTKQGSKDWDKQDTKKPDQKKPDLNQDTDQDSENE